MNGVKNEIQRFLSQEKNNAQRYSNTYIPSIQYSNIELLYPGRKGDQDYRLAFNGVAVSHLDIATAFYNLSNEYSQELIDFIVDIYNRGLSATYSINLPNTIKFVNHVISFDEFKHLIYFTILQEEINYPEPRYQGIRMPLRRFIEAVVSSVQPEIITFDKVKCRIENHKCGAPLSIKNSAGLEQIFVNAFNVI